jgi:hypothetical protein
MTQAKARSTANKTFIVQASLMTINDDRQNMFIVQPTGQTFLGEPSSLILKWSTKVGFVLTRKY